MQCAQLLAQIIIAIRVAVGSIVVALHETIALPPGAANHSANTSSSQLLSGPDISAPTTLKPSKKWNSGPLLYGLALLGRICWLLKIRGRFLEDALTPITFTTAPHGEGSASRTSSHSSSSGDAVGPLSQHQHRFELSSEDQLVSACEIADTNGDGILTFSEAVEVRLSVDGFVFSA